MATSQSPGALNETSGIALATSTTQPTTGSVRHQLVVWSLAFLALGVGWRSYRYLAQFPVWGDEAYIALNLCDRTYSSFLTEELRYAQAAPILFLWGELSAYQIFGSSELSLRLLPFLAGLAVLPLMWRFAHITLGPTTAVLAVALLCVSYYPIRHACEIKPYSFDLLMSLGLILLAAEWIRRPEQRLWLIWLSVALIPALGFSNPTVFVAGAVSVGLLPTLWKQKDRKAWALWVMYNSVLCATFATTLQINMHMQSTEGYAFLQSYWREAFPPGEPWPFIKWFFDVHTGNMMAYPIGGKNGGSIVTLLLMLTGLGYLVRTRRYELIAICVGPFVLTFIAACLGRYPYGVSARVAQHLAAPICLMAAAGIAALLTTVVRNPLHRQRWATIWFVGLAAVAAFGIARDVVQPFKQQTDIQGRRIVQDIVSRAGSNPIVLLNNDKQMMPEFIWYLTQSHSCVHWESDVDWQGLMDSQSKLVCLKVQHHGRPKLGSTLPLRRPVHGWQQTIIKVHSRPLDERWGITEYCLETHWRRQKQKESE